MLRRLLVLFLFGALLTASAAACGGGGGALSLEDYFQELDTILADVEAELDDLDEQYPDVFVDPDQTRDSFDKAIPLVEGAVGDVRDLTPPEEAKDAHQEFLDAADDVLEAYGTLSDRVEDVESEDELDQVLTELDAEVSPVFERIDDACFGLQSVADDNDVDVGLNCEGGIF